MFVYIHVYIYIHIYMYIYPHTHLHTHMYISITIAIAISISLSIYLSVYISVYIERETFTWRREVYRNRSVRRRRLSQVSRELPRGVPVGSALSGHVRGYVEQHGLRGVEPVYTTKKGLTRLCTQQRRGSIGSNEHGNDFVFLQCR